TPFPVSVGGQAVVRWLDGGLLGQWAVGTRAAVKILERVKSLRNDPVQAVDLLRLNAALTDTNAAIFDPSNGFAGCIPGIHEVLRRQGLLENLLTLDTDARLSPGQADEITRVHRKHFELNDDEFVAENIDGWLG